MSRQISWWRVLSEGVVIVGSILLAFGIQAWWDERQEEERVRQDLENVASELGLNRELLLFQAEIDDRMATAARAMAERMEPEAARAVINLVDTLVFLGWSTPPTLDPSLGALDALVVSGSLSTVEDPELRSNLSSLRAQFDDVLEGQHRGVAFYEANLADFPYDDTEPRRVEREFWFGERVTGRPLSSRGSVAFPNSAALRQALRHRAIVQDLSSREALALVAELDHISDLINRYVGS